MIFARTDGLDNQGNNQVSYSLVDCPGYTFAIVATRVGVYISGTTPAYTDARAINDAMTRAYAQYNSLSTQGVAVPENVLFGWKLWPIGPAILFTLMRLFDGYI